MSGTEYRVPSLKMWPTSIAGSMCSTPSPHAAHVSPSDTSRRSWNSAWKSRPASTPRRCQPVRFAPPTYWPSRSDSSAMIAHLHADRPDRPRIGAELRADLVGGRRPVRLPERPLGLHLVQAIVSAYERKHHLAVGDDRHRLRRGRRVDPEHLGQAVDRGHVRRLDLDRRIERRRQLGAARPRRAPPRRSPRSRSSSTGRAPPRRWGSAPRTPRRRGRPSCRRRPRPQTSRGRSGRRSACTPSRCLAYDSSRPARSRSKL